MADILKVFYGAWAGPGPSYFRVVAEVWGYVDTGEGFDLRLRRWVQVNDGGNFYGTVIDTAWAGNINIYGSGNYYALTETESYHIKYGETFTSESQYNAASYTGSKFHDSRTSVSYTVPKPTYTVSYNANGGSGEPSAQTKTYGTNLTLSKTVPTRTGYTFKSWNTKNDGSGTSYAAGGTYTANAAVTLYAQWTANTYTVSYNANGGSGAPGSQTKTYGASLTLSGTKPTRTGYTFKNWNTKSDGSGTSYVSGGTYAANSGVTLYAQWTINTYAVTYNANGGTGAPSAQTKTYGTNLTLSKTIPIRIGYTFKSWNTQKDGNGTSYAPGGTYTANSAATLYAQWEVITYAVTYDANGGTGAPSAQTKTYETNLTLSKTIPIRIGYDFLGWSTSKTEVIPEYLAGGTYTKNAAITLYAVWKRKGGMCITMDGQARKGRPCLYQNGERRAGITWIKVNGVWKKGV